MEKQPKEKRKLSDEESNGLQMAPELMLELARKAVVCFRINPADTAIEEEELAEINKTILARIFWEDKAFISSTLLHGKFSLRLCIVNHTTTWDDMRETLEATERFGREALA